MCEAFVALAKKDTSIIKTIIKSYLIEIKRKVDVGELSPNSVSNRIKPIKALLSANEVDISWKMINKMFPREIKSQDRAYTRKEIQDMVPDIIWLVFGGLGAILYVFDYSNVTSYHVITMIMGGFASFMIWRWRLAGTADAFAVLTMTVILPVHYEFVMVPILAVIGGFVIAGFGILVNYAIHKISSSTSSSLKNLKKPQPFVAYMFGMAALLFI